MVRTNQSVNAEHGPHAFEKFSFGVKDSLLANRELGVVETNVELQLLKISTIDPLNR